MGLTTILGGFVLALLVSLLLTRIAIPLGRLAGIMDKPDGVRKLHDHPVPRVGGVALYFAIIIPSIVLILFLRQIPVAAILADNMYLLIMCGAGAGLIMLLGLFDDIFDLKPIIKVFAQIIVAVIMYLSGFKIIAVINPLDGGNIFLGFLELPATVLWFLVCMNIVNLLDGIDGLAAGACLFVGITLFFLSLSFRNDMGMFLMASYAGAILGFLYFNFPPAKIFLGDSGSLLLGFFIASLTLLGGIRKADAAVALFIPVVALGLPILDTSLAIVRRWYKRLPIASSDKMHIHHRLVKGLGYKRALLTLYAICVILLGAAMLITFGSNEVVLFVIVILTLLVFACFRFFSGINVTDVINRIAEAENRRELRAESMAKVYRAISLMETAEDNDVVWSICKDLFEDIGMCRVVFTSGDVSYEYGQDSASRSDESDGGCEISLPLKIGDGSPSEIVFSKKISKSKPIAVDAEMLMILRDGLERYFVGKPSV